MHKSLTVRIISRVIIYRHECFTGKYSTRKIHTKLHPGLHWRIFHILTSEDINDFADSLSLKLYLKEQRHEDFAVLGQFCAKIIVFEALKCL